MLKCTYHRRRKAVAAFRPSITDLLPPTATAAHTVYLCRKCYRTHHGPKPAPLLTLATETLRYYTQRLGFD